MENFNTEFHQLNNKLEHNLIEFDIKKVTLFENTEKEKSQSVELESIYSLVINDNFYILKYNTSLTSFFLIQKTEYELNFGDTFSSDFIPITFKKNKNVYQSIYDTILHISRYNEIPNEFNE